MDWPSDAQYVVRVDRMDGTRDYQGPTTLEFAERDLNLWQDAYPLYDSTILLLADAWTDLADFHSWHASRGLQPNQLADYVPGSD